MSKMLTFSDLTAFLSIPVGIVAAFFCYVGFVSGQYKEMVFMLVVLILMSPQWFVVVKKLRTKENGGE